MKEEPFDGPRDYARNDVFVRPPLVFLGIINAQFREFGRMPPPIHMLRRLAGAARIRADRRVDDKYADVMVHQIPLVKVTSREIDDADSVGLTDRAERALPDADPAGVCDEAKLRAFSPQPVVLFLYRQRAHCA
jgi:hypothetical protein